MTETQRRDIETACALLTNHPDDLPSVGRARELLEQVLAVKDGES
jgi:hypothetical protein